MAAYQTDEFPAFFTETSGCKVLSCCISRLILLCSTFINPFNDSLVLVFQGDACSYHRNKVSQLLRQLSTGATIVSIMSF